MEVRIWQPYLDAYNLLPKRDPKNSGLIGCVGELVIRAAALFYRKGYEGAFRAVPCVKPQGKPDMIWNIKDPETGKYKDKTFSIKIGHGEVEEDIPEDYMVYVPSLDPEKPIYEQAYVFTREEWKEFLTGYPGRGAFLRYDKARGFWHIQSMQEFPYTPPEGIDFPSRKGAPKASGALLRYALSVCAMRPTYGAFLKAHNRYKEIKF